MIVIDGSMGGYARFRRFSIGDARSISEPNAAWNIPAITRGHIGRELPPRDQATANLAISSSLAYFVGAIERRERPVPDGQLARHSLEIMLAARRAAETGQRQQLETTFDFSRLPDAL